MTLETRLFRALAITCLTVTLLLAAAPGRAETEPAMSFDIPAQSLAKALKQFAASTNKEILFSPELVAGREAPALQGSYTPSAALARLLADSGLVYDEAAKNVIVVKRKGSSERGSDQAQVWQGFKFTRLAQASETRSTGSNGPGAGGEPGTISGRVLDEGTNAPLAGAIVRVVGTNLTATTDLSGEYRLAAVPAGSYELAVDYLGSETVTAQVRVEPGQRVAQDFVLPTTVTTVVVRGQRSATAQALSQQRAASNVATVVASDLLGSFPAETISEALRRVPGVAFARDDDTGEGAKITVRGFSSEAINIKLNGLDLQGTGFERSVDLSGFLTEGISQVTIHKTLMPSHEATGSGGLVEIETRSGLDFGDRYLSFGLEREWSGRGEFGDEPQGTVTGAWKFTPNFGIAGTLEYRTTDRRNFDVQPLQTTVPVLPAGYTSDFLIPESYDYPFDPQFTSPLYTGANYRQRLRDEENLTASVNLALNVGGHTALRLDAKHIQRDALRITSTAVQSFLASSFDMPIPELGGEIRRRSVINSFRPTLNTVASDTRAKISTFSLRGDTTAGPWDLGYKVGYSRSKSEGQHRTLQFTPATAANAALYIDPSTVVIHPDDDATNTPRVVDGAVRFVNRVPMLALSQAGIDLLTDPAIYPLTNATRSLVNSPADALIGEAKARFNFSSGLFSYVEGGFKFNDGNRSNIDDNFATSVAAIQSAETYSRITGRDTMLGDFLATPFEMLDLGLIGARGRTVGVVPVHSVDAIFSRLAQLTQDDPSTPYNEQRFSYTNYTLLDPILNPSALSPNKVREKRMATYLESMIDFGKLEIVGGARYERVDRTSVSIQTPSFRFADGTQEPRETFVNAGLLDFRELSGVQDTLTPSLLATYRQTENMIWRLGYFRSTVNPDFRMLIRSPQIIVDLRPNFNQGIIRESNPDLKPTRTHNFDLDVSYYFKHNPGLIRGAVFLKRVSNNFTSVVLNDVPNSVVRQRILDTLAPLGATRPEFLDLPEDGNYMLNRPINSEGGNIWGVEVEFIRQLDFLPGFWSDFSFLANATYTDGDVPALVSARDDSGTPITLAMDRALEDQSEWSGTVSLGYEREGFSGRLIYTYQSEYVTTFHPHNLNTIVPSYSTLDLRMSYLVNRGGARYQIFFEADDLLNGPDDPDYRSAIAPTFATGSPDFFFPTLAQYSGGRNYTLGLKVTF